jgi:hypothetical protein
VAETAADACREAIDAADVAKSVAAAAAADAQQARERPPSTRQTPAQVSRRARTLRLG